MLNRNIFILVLAALLPLKPAWCQGGDPQSTDSTVVTYIYDYTIQECKEESQNRLSNYMILEIGRNYSRFTSYRQMLTDSLPTSGENESPEDFEKRNQLIRQYPVSTLAQFCVYKHYPAKNTVRLEMPYAFDNTIYFTEEPKLQFGWELLPNSDTTIMDFPCQKAAMTYGGRQWEAWYTLAIPVPEGPYKFMGLPGLIVAIHDRENQHQFLLRGTLNGPIRSIPNPSNGEDKTGITRGKFIKLMKKLPEESVRQFKEMDIRTDEASYARLIHNIARKNNFIEFE